MKPWQTKKFKKLVKMKPGTIVKIKGRGLATVVWHNLNGYGVIWGEHSVDTDNLPEPQALLREPCKIAEYECVGEDYEIIKEGYWNEND